MTATENLFFAGRLHGLSGRHLAERVGFALEVAALAPRRDDHVKGLGLRLNARRSA